MSGHSHWKKVKHQKGCADVQRGQIFSKMARLITIAARQGGDPSKNSKLKDAIGKSKSINMPSSNVERAIKKGTGDLDGGKLEEMLFEAYGPGKIAIMIDIITDNKNRALAEIKQILSRNRGKLAADGSVKWLFDRKGVLSLSLGSQSKDFQDKENLELTIIDSGAEDIFWDEDDLEIHTQGKNLDKVKAKLEKQDIKIKSSGLGWVAKKEVTISDDDKKVANKLFEALDENDNVQEIYSNFSL